MHSGQPTSKNQRQVKSETCKYSDIKNSEL